MHIVYDIIEMYQSQVLAVWLFVHASLIRTLDNQESCCTNTD